MLIEKYSFGIGDRFGFEGNAQLRALQKALDFNTLVVPVWNKSNREHLIIGTTPEEVYEEAKSAVQSCNWKWSYYVDADHVGYKTVDKFIEHSNFFTVDVADYIGKPASADAIKTFTTSLNRFRGNLEIPNIKRHLEITNEVITQIAQKYLFAIEEAGRVYRYIADRKGADNFITEVSLDEANLPQSPIELFFILAALAEEKIPIQTIAPKFTGSFLKGIDYVGDISKFASEFEEDLAVIAYATKIFNLPRNLKLSIHSGSDKFSLYPIIHNLILKFNAGLHLKTAGTTWLEEVIGLASCSEGLMFAKRLYQQAYARFDELCKPYSTVIDIDVNLLPKPEYVNSWMGEEFIQALEHNQSCEKFNKSFRQLIHVGYKIAAENGEYFKKLLTEYREQIETNVSKNIFERHVKPLFVG